MQPCIPATHDNLIAAAAASPVCTGSSNSSITDVSAATPVCPGSGYLVTAPRYIDKFPKEPEILRKPLGHSVPDVAV